MNQEERSQQPGAGARCRARAVFAPGVPRDQHARHRRAGRRVDGQRLPPLQGQGDDLPRLLDVYWRAIEDPEFPINRALRTGSFPENLEDIGRAARESVAQYRPYVTLIYVDVVEFEGSHIRKFYSDMAGRFERFVAAHRDEIKLEGKLRPEIQPASAVMLAFRTFLQHFAVELCSACRTTTARAPTRWSAKSPHPAPRHAQAAGLSPHDLLARTLLRGTSLRGAKAERRPLYDWPSHQR